MIKTDNIIYLSDDYIYFKNYKRKNIIKYNIPKKIIVNNKIANISKFSQALSTLIKEYKLNNSLIKETITVIINSNYSDVDNYILKNIFESFNYKKINFVDENKLYHLNNSNAYINIKGNNALLTYIDNYKKTETIFIPNNFFSNIEDLNKFINSKIQNKEVLLLGYGDLLASFFNTYEQKYHTTVYLYTDNEFYIIDNYSKKIGI